jgi:hypothetical protein
MLSEGEESGGSGEGASAPPVHNESRLIRQIEAEREMLESMAAQQQPQTTPRPHRLHTEL